MSDVTFFKGVLEARWLAVDTDCEGEPWPGISAEGLNSAGGPLVFWMADEGMDDAGLRDHIVALHNACHALDCPPDELEPRVQRLLGALSCRPEVDWDDDYLRDWYNEFERRADEKEMTEQERRHWYGHITLEYKARLALAEWRKP